MPAPALSDALPDFGSVPRLAAVARGQAREPVAAVVAPVSVEPDPAIMRAAIAEAEAELAAQLAEEHEAALAALGERHAAELAALRTELGESLAQRVGERMTQFEERLIALTGAAAARMLSVVLTEDIQKHAVEQLGAAIAGAVADREAVRIRVRGPALLYEALGPALGERIANVEFSEAQGLDLTVEIDDGIFETRLSEWSAVLSEVLG